MKRNRIWPYLGIGAITALILALVLVALPAGAATSGSVQGVQGDLTILDKPDSDKDSTAIAWVSPTGTNSFYIHLEDSDLDVATSITRDINPDCTGADDLTVLARPGPEADSSGRVPILDSNGDGRFTAADVEIVYKDNDGDVINAPATSYVEVLTVNGPDGIITLNCTESSPGGFNTNVKYDTSAVDTTFTGSTVTAAKAASNGDPAMPEMITGGADRVTVTSGADRRGITARLVETRRDSGEFELMIRVCDDTGCSQTGRMHDVENEEKDAGPDAHEASPNADDDRFYYVPSGTSRGSTVYAVYDDLDTSDNEAAKYILQEKPATASTDPSDIEAQIQVFVTNPESTEDDPLDDILTTEKHLSVSMVDAGSRELTIVTAKAIPAAPDPVEVFAASDDDTVSGQTTLTATDNAFEKFVRGDLVEVRTGRGTSVADDDGAELLVVKAHTDDNIIILDGELTSDIKLDSSPTNEDSSDGGTITKLGVTFKVSYRTSADDDEVAMIRVNPAGDTVTVLYNDPDDTRERATIKVETTAPAIDELSDSSNGAGGDATPTFFAEVTDQGSGITTSTKDADSIEFVFMLMSPNGTELDGPPPR